jgi:hypothetical protein
MVTHSSTSRPVQCLCMAERTGCPVFTDLWSYVLYSERFGYTITGVLASRIREITADATRSVAVEAQDQ